MLSLLAGMRRTWYLTMRHGWRLSRWTCLTASPSFVVALVTALSWHDDRRRRDDVDDAHSTLTPFQELRQALPLVLWHVTWLTSGAVTALAVVIRYVAETVYDDDGGRQRQRKVVTTTSWRVSVMTALTRHGGVLTAAGTFVVGSCAVVYVVGHVLTVGLRDLRRDAQSAHDKNPLVFGSIACASWIMTVAVDVTVVFVVVWMACMYGFAVPVIVLERNVDDDRDDNTNVPVEVFRKAYVLARDSRSYLVASWTGAVWIPATVVTLLAVTWPLHAVTTRWPGRDYVDWQLGTIPGVVALYAPLMILWLPLCGMYVVCFCLVACLRLVFIIMRLAILREVLFFVYMLMLSYSHLACLSLSALSLLLFTVTRPSCT